MSFSVSDTPFRVHVRPDPSMQDALVVRFELNEGMGVLGLRKVGREDPQPTVHFEETEVDAEYLRAGRFVHVLASGQRQSYALSRISADIIRRLPDDQWVELKPVTEYGFRYLVVPEELALKARTAAAIAVGPAVQVASAPAGVTETGSASPVAPAPRPQPVTKISATPAPSADRQAAPPRQVAMDPALASAALERLTREEAVDHLRRQMAKVEQLHLRVIELQQQLEQSHTREQDLLQLLVRWQQM